MGVYRGLLLNAPYKIDSIVWMRLGLSFYFFHLSLFVLFFRGLYEPEDKIGCEP
jgi:hypothetical protein